MHIDIISVVPELLASPLSHSIMQRAQDKGLLSVAVHDLRPYGLDVGAYDFKFAAVNLNMVYRWEYRPGSTVYLVWTHSKQRYDVRGPAPDPYAWDNDFDLGYVTDSEPRNTFLAKVSYWFSI